MISSTSQKLLAQRAGGKQSILGALLMFLVRVTHLIPHLDYFPKELVGRHGHETVGSSDDSVGAGPWGLGTLLPPHSDLLLLHQVCEPPSCMM